MKTKFTAAQISIGFVCLVMAFGITLQIKSVKYNKAAVINSDNVRASDLQVQLVKEREKSNELLKQVIEYKDQLQTLKTQITNNDGQSEFITKQLEKAELLAGLTEVEGSGLTVTMRDSRSKNQILADPNLYVIHDSDILSVINELRDAGAEAIMLNGERLVATSEIRCSGSTVSVNNNRYSEPYEIKAIGDPTNMENALLMRDGVYDYLTGYGIEINIKKVNKLKINRFSGTINYKYAIQIVPSAAPIKEGN